MFLVRNYRSLCFQISICAYKTDFKNIYIYLLTDILHNLLYHNLHRADAGPDTLLMYGKCIAQIKKKKYPKVTLYSFSQA